MGQVVDSRVHVKDLLIRNFKAIREAEFNDLPATVVVAGGNGCGKSTILDALRFWKSAQDQKAELQQFFGEMTINPQNRHELGPLFRDPQHEIVIDATVTLSDQERECVQANLEDLTYEYHASRYALQGPGARGAPARALVKVSPHAAQIEQGAAEMSEQVRKQMTGNEYQCRVTVKNGDGVHATPSPLLQLLLAPNSFEVLGAFEFHGAQRAYQREQVANVNLRGEDVAMLQAQNALYNGQAKYQNIKTQLASAYVQDLLAREAGGRASDAAQLLGSLTALFQTFFPEKEFEGPRPLADGTLSFAVRGRDGTSFDINELSSGEKELVFGYMRLQTLKRRNSVLLLDEPELHLNPRLIGELVPFYERHLGSAKGNQIWLVTHSDVLLKSGLGQSSTAVFHLVPPSGFQGSQARRISENEAGRALVDLVGASVLATHKPIVVLEGEGREFDVQLVTKLFPKLGERVQLVAGTDKARAQSLASLLAKVHPERGVCAVVDKDFDQPSSGDALEWDVYHIENYLLESAFLAPAISSLSSVAVQPPQVEEALRSACESRRSMFIQMQLTRWANRQIKQALGAIGCEPADPVTTLTGSIAGARGRLDASFCQLDQPAVKREHDRLDTAFDLALENGSWRSIYPVREILRAFCSVSHTLTGVRSIPYDRLVSEVSWQMRVQDYQPEPMKKVLEAAVSRASAQRGGAVR